MGKLDDVPWKLRQDIGYYAATVEGSVRIAAMINRMYSDQLRELDSTATVWGNPGDMLIISAGGSNEEKAQMLFSSQEVYARHHNGWHCTACLLHRISCYRHGPSVFDRFR